MFVAPIPISLLLRATISVEIAILPVLLAQIYPVGPIFAFVPIVIILVLVIVIATLLSLFVMFFLRSLRGRICSGDDSGRREQRGCEESRTNQSIASVHEISLGWMERALLQGVVSSLIVIKNVQYRTLRWRVGHSPE
jgi:uncharacterized membrane protein